MATGEIQALRHEIRDIVQDARVYNGLAGRAGLSFDQQRAELSTIAPRVADEATALRTRAQEQAAALNAKADELEAKQTKIQELVAKAVAIVDSREADPNFEAAVADEGDDPDFEEEDDDFEDEDFEEYDEEEETA